MSGHDDWYRDNYSAFDNDLHRSAPDNRDFPITQAFQFGDDRYNPGSAEGQHYRSIETDGYDDCQLLDVNDHEASTTHVKWSDLAIMLILGVCGAVALCHLFAVITS